MVSATLLLATPSAHAAKILFVVNSFTDATTPSNAHDQEVLDRLTSQGHAVTLADDNPVSAADTVGMDLVLISSSTSSAAAGVNALCANTLRSGRIPVICYEPGLYDELLMQTQNTFGNAAGHTSIAISNENKNHPLAAGKSGAIDIVNPGDSAVISSSAFPYTVGKDALIIATNATPDIDVGRICMWAYEKGSRLADDNTIASSRRVALFYNASTAPGVYNDNATALFDASIKWALQAPANLPITVSLKSPAAANGAPDAAVVLELENGTSSQVNTNTISLSLNGNPVTPQISKNGNITTVSFKPSTLFTAGSVNNVRVVFSDNSTPAVTSTNTFQFTIENFATIPPRMKVPETAVNRSKTGFILKLRQSDTARPGGSTLTTVRQQLNDTLIDPSTGAPLVDVIDRSQTGFAGGSGFNANGTFTETGVINYNQDAGTGADAGEFRDPTATDKPIPGVPGTSGSTDNIAMDARTVLDLKAGLYRFGVNSDDGFGVFVGSNPEDAFSVLAGAFNADRGAATTQFTVFVAEDGLYPFSLVWWETGGGAEVEFFSIDNATAEKILVNDTSNAKSVKAFQPPASSGGLPTITSVKPAPGALSVPKNAGITITIADATAQVVTSSVKLTLDNNPVTPTVNKANGVTTITFTPSAPFTPLSVHTVGLQFTDTASPPNTRSETFSFTVESSLPKVLFLHTATATTSDVKIAAHLKSLGFEVVEVIDTASQTSDADGKSLIVISSSVGSGNVNTKFTAAAVPLLDWETALYDDLGFDVNDAAGAGVGGQTQLTIVDPQHPIAAGLPAGLVTVLSTAGNIDVINDLVPSGKIIATLPDGTDRPAIFAIEKGAALQAGRIATAPARRVGFFLENDTFTNATAEGVKLFDAAVTWLVGGNLPKPEAKFNVPTLSGKNMTLSWTGTGTLQESTSIIGGWTNSANQSNPQTVTISGGSKFYRLQQ